MQYNVFLYAYKTTEYTENSDELVVSIYNISISYLILYNHLCIIEISYTTKIALREDGRKHGDLPLAIQQDRGHCHFPTILSSLLLR